MVLKLLSNFMLFIHLIAEWESETTYVVGLIFVPLTLTQMCQNGAQLCEYILVEIIS